MTNEPSSAELRAILASVTEAGWDYARIELDGVTIVVSTDPDADSGTSVSIAEAGTSAPVAAAPAAPTTVTPQPAPASAAPEAPISEAELGDFITVESPSIGLFWRSPKPGAPPFVEVGQAVVEDDTVCIVEVMKLMTHVKAGRAGTIARIRHTNGEMVEFGTPLIDISL